MTGGRLQGLKRRVRELELSRAMPESLLYFPLIPLFVVFYLYDRLLEWRKERRQKRGE